MKPVDIGVMHARRPNDILALALGSPKPGTNPDLHPGLHPRYK